VIFDPLNDTMEFWKEAVRLDGTIIVTPDNRRAIGLSAANYKCTLWSWPERKEIGHCSERLRGIFGAYLDSPEALALSSDGKFFAIGVGNNVRVYRIEPFKLEYDCFRDSQAARATKSRKRFWSTGKVELNRPVAPPLESSRFRPTLQAISLP